MIYIQYFFSGVRTADMDPFTISIIGGVRYVVLLFVAAISAGLTNNLANGNYTFDLADIKGWIMPVVVVLVGFIWKYAREATNPAVSISKIDTVSSMLPPRDPNVPMR